MSTAYNRRTKGVARRPYPGNVGLERDIDRATAPRTGVTNRTFGATPKGRARARKRGL